MRLNEVAKSEEVFKIQLHNKFDRFFFFFFIYIVVVLQNSTKV